MREIQIEAPNGYLLDSSGDVVTRFGQWRIGQHQVRDAVDSVEYVDGPTAHTKPVAEKYRN